jgi:hypothetical protein
MPPDREDLVIMRILVRHGFSRDLGELFIADVQRCLDYFKKNPIAHSLTRKDAGGYSHSCPEPGKAASLAAQKGPVPSGASLLSFRRRGTKPNSPQLS